ncbi:hypothetical protein Thini_1319 [Thiothrix nivea DSM 5205]|uniref:Uncharacterized protein n=1 Tax=Thiothrix nivea (strain ATCC 35100 / DSM 5205 / JP2) TaxID=870187 RepID=A0A656HD81_THINJ|nr:hypothetical protein Thini_1319 [Thiothrix nivea DSM 5205]
MMRYLSFYLKVRSWHVCYVPHLLALLTDIKKVQIDDKKWLAIV